VLQENIMSMDVVTKFYSVYNDRRVDLLDELLAPEYAGHVNGREIVGPAAARVFIQNFLTAFPDVQYTMEDTLEDGAKVVVRWSATATHQGAFAGIQPTQKPVTMSGITIFALKDERITALWSTWDVLGVLNQFKA
jgi:steroid delta-isomerase-like uncharacterized protein